MNHPVTGVVIGKFYPPHRGHHHLIRVARSQVDRLVVIVCDLPSQTIPAALRARWLREVHPDCEIIITPDDLPEAPEPWGNRTVQLVGKAPDLVFSSESYGDPYAASMGARHILVDLDRLAVPVSGTAIRQAPHLSSQYLEPCVSSYYVPRIVLVGAESTGKTTLADLLASHFHVPWVPEFGREFSETKFASDTPWSTADFVVIATEQQRREDFAARTNPRLLICDTNAWATGTWHERYVGHRSPEVDEIGRLDRADLYLVPSPTVAFVQDGLRDGEHLREWMHQRFVDQLTEQNLRYQILEGAYNVRLATAVIACENVLHSYS